MQNFGGIDLGGTKIQAVVVDSDHNVLGAAREPTPTAGGPEDVARAMIGALDIAHAQAGGAELEAVGVGSPGVVDDAAGTVTSARNLPGWEASYTLAEHLRSALKAPVTLSNDVNAATHAEFERGAGREFQSILGVFWGTGVGGGLILDGRLWEGCGAAGELGHVVVKADGRRCPCGRQGCLEAYAGRGAMEARARLRAEAGQETVLFEIMEEKGRDRLSSGIWERALEREDRLAQHLIDRAVGALGIGIASAINLLDVDAVIIGGGLGLRLGDAYVEKIRAAMLPHVFVSHRPPQFRLAELGDLGGAIGAAWIAMRSKSQRPAVV